LALTTVTSRERRPVSSWVTFSIAPLIMDATDEEGVQPDGIWAQLSDQRSS
jgi:hypothetical protein